MRILLFGGSKFMGLDLLIKLSKIENVEIFVINRGKIHWNGLFYELVKSNKNIYHFISDRDNDNQFKTTLNQIKQLVSKSSQPKNENFIYFDYIIDFSCFVEDDAKLVLEEFPKLFKYYIFISTDSVYNASNISLERNEEFFLCKDDSNKIESVKEEEGYLSESSERRKKLKKRDSYGYNKLKCERYLQKYFEQYKESYFIALRLPDVIGSFDESFRMWYYVEWIKNSNLRKIEYEKIDLVRPLSLVLKDDVTELICKLVNSEKHDANILNQSYNIAFEETLTLKELVDCVSGILNIPYEYSIITEGTSKSYYPSVSFGSISIEKAKKFLNWKPSALKIGIEQSVKFFENDGRNYQKEFEKMKKDLPDEIRKELK